MCIFFVINDEKAKVFRVEIDGHNKTGTVTVSFKKTSPLFKHYIDIPFLQVFVPKYYMGCKMKCDNMRTVDKVRNICECVTKVMVMLFKVQITWGEDDIKKYCYPIFNYIYITSTIISFQTLDEILGVMTFLDEDGTKHVMAYGTENTYFMTDLTFVSNLKLQQIRMKRNMKPKPKFFRSLNDDLKPYMKKIENIKSLRKLK